MATKNEDLVSDTAAALLTAIKANAERATASGHLRDLAEAFSLVAGSDPRRPPAAPGRIR